MALLGRLVTWGSGAEAAPEPVGLGPHWVHSEIVMDLRSFDPRLRQTIIVQYGSQVSTIPADDTQRWPK